MARQGWTYRVNNMRGMAWPLLLAAVLVLCPRAWAGSPAVTLTPASLKFPATQLNTAAATQSITLKNTGSATLALNGKGEGISIGGPAAGSFRQTNTCGTSVAAGASCFIKVTFKPAAEGALSASLVVADDAASSPQKTALSGTGLAPVASLSPASLNFISTPLGQTSTAKTIILKNTGNATLVLNGKGEGISIGGTGASRFTVKNSCGATLAAGASCSIGVSFKPASAGTVAATLTVADNAAGSPQKASLSGTGTPVSLPPTPSRTNYIRTDAVTEYFSYWNPNWEAYDPVSNRFFVTDPAGNTLNALDAQTETWVGRIGIPGALTVDITPDHSKLWVATEQGDLYTVNPVTMQVTARYPSEQIGPQGYPAIGAYVLASGKLVLLAGPISIDGMGGSVWDPLSNQLTPLPDCVSAGAFMLSGDRKKVIEGSALSDGTLCVIDPETGSYITAASGREFVFGLTPTPDGKSLLSSDYENGQTVDVYDVATLSRMRSFPVVGDTGSASSMLVTADSKTVWMTKFGGAVLVAYDLVSGKLKGWAPGPYLPVSSGGSAWGPVNLPALQAMDLTGLIAGPMEEGVGFVDTSKLIPGAPPMGFTNAYLTPATGPLAGGTQTTWEAFAQNPFSQAYFGSRLASNVNETSLGYTAVTPAAAKGGPVTIYALTADGDEQLVPDGFSYGPTILEVTTDLSEAAGGGTGMVFGYGFGPAGAATIPSDLRVTVGGKPASITGFAPKAYGLVGPPFPLQAIAYTMPAGRAGARADVVVTTSSGSARAAGAVSYLPNAALYPLQNASLAQGVYDPKRELYYFTDATQIRVFSRVQGKWLAPIAVPAAPAGLTHRLWGIAVSADGSKLAVADLGARRIYLLNPTSPGNVKQFPVHSWVAGIQSSGFACPIGVVVTNAGVIYYSVMNLDSIDDDGYFKLDSVSGKTLDYQLGEMTNDQSRLALTADESLLYLNYSGDAGYPYVIDTATDMLFGGWYPGGVEDLALAANQQVVAFPGVVYDSNYNVQDYMTLNDREISFTTWVNGMKLSPDGNLVFQPSVAGIDVFDAHRGFLHTRLALPFALSQNYDALVSDGADNILVAITGASGNGVAVLDMSGISEPAPWPFAKPARQPGPLDTRALVQLAPQRGAAALQRPAPPAQFPAPRLFERIPHRVAGKDSPPVRSLCSAPTPTDEAAAKGMRVAECKSALETETQFLSK